MINETTHSTTIFTCIINSRINSAAGPTGPIPEGSGDTSILINTGWWTIPWDRTIVPMGSRPRCTTRTGKFKRLWYVPLLVPWYYLLVTLHKHTHFLLYD